MKLSNHQSKGFTRVKVLCYDPPTMRQKFRIMLVICLAWCIDRDLYKALDYLREQIQALVNFKKTEQADLAQQPSNAGGYPSNRPLPHLPVLNERDLYIPYKRVFSARILVTKMSPQEPSLPNQVRENVALLLKEASCKNIFSG
jgi:hypothetical protein